MDDCPIVLSREPEFRIGAVLIRPPTREIIHESNRAIVEPRVMQLLVALHQAAGAVVSKDELIRLCWKGRIVGDDAINRVVSRLRAAAEKPARGSFRVETITKVGYRLVASGTDAQPNSAVAAKTSGELGPEMSKRRLLVAAGAGTGLLLAGGYLGYRRLTGDPMNKEARALLEDASRALLSWNSNEDANAVGMLKRAVVLEPDDARVWGMLALAYMRLLRSAPPEQGADLRQRGEGAAARALALDPDQPDARSAMIHTMPVFGNWLAYERACTGALRRHPDHFELCLLNAGLLSQVGRIAEILPLAQKAAPRAPTHPEVQVGFALTLIEIDRLEDGERQLEHCFSLWPGNSWVWFTRFQHYLYGHRPEEALRMIRDEGHRPKGVSPRRFELAQLQAETVLDPDPARTRTALDRMEEGAAYGASFAENAAKFAASRGDLDRSFRILEALYFGKGLHALEAAGEQDVERNTFFLFWRVFRPARSDPRFARLTRALGLEDYWRRTGTRDRVAY